MRQVKSLATVSNKEGRLDCLLHSLTVMLTQKIETKTNLPGLSSSVMPILEDEIKKVVPAKTIIPKKYQGLARLVGEQFGKQPPPPTKRNSNSKSDGVCHCPNILCGGIGSTCTKCGGMIL